MTIPGFDPKPDAPVAGHYLQPIEIIFLVIAAVLLLTRLYSRMVILKTPGIDDVFASLAFVFALGVTIDHILSVEYGWGRHYTDLYRPNAVKAWICELINWLFYPLSSLFTKLSILGFYLRFTFGRKLRIAVYCTMAFITIWTVALFITLLNSCKPLAQWWSYSIPNGKCWDSITLGIILFVQTAMNLISDVVIFALPIRTVWGIRVERKEKMLMVGLLSLGLVVCLIALIRIPLLLPGLLKSDVTWYGYAFYTAIAVEMHLGVACACLPFCKPAMKAFLGSKAAAKVKSSFGSSRGQTSGNGGRDAARNPASAVESMDARRQRWQKLGWLDPSTSTEMSTVTTMTTVSGKESTNTEPVVAGKLVPDGTTTITVTEGDIV